MESASTKFAAAEALLDNAPCGFIVFNDEGEILFVNNTLATMLNVQQADLPGKKFESLLTIAGRIFYQTHFFPLIKLHGKAEEIFLTLVGANRTEVPVLLNAKRVSGDDGYENHCVLLSVPQRKKYEDELIEAKRSLEQLLNKNELLYQTKAELEQHKIELDRQVTRLSNLNEDLVEFGNVISHDVQEPIRKIAMFADIIYREDHGKLSDVSKTSISKIKIASRRMRDLISCLQQFISVDAPQTEVELCDIDDLISRARLRVMFDTQFRDIEINTGLLPKVEGLQDQLELMFYHLLLNAVQFRRDEKVTIQVEADIIQQNSYQATEGKYRYTDFVRIRFTDMGVGFDSQYSEYIFGLFKKAHAEATGLGFGLALCRKIVANHNGTITASSSGQKGTTFTILLPEQQA